MSHSPMQPSRRALVAAPLALLAPPLPAAVDAGEFRDKLAGPICSVPTPFLEDFSIDHAAVKTIVECGLESGCQTFTLTAGNNLYDRLTYDEIKALTTTLVKAVNGRGMVIGATGPWWTGQSAGYARFATQAGVDAVQVMLPAYGTEDALFEHYRTVARAAGPRGIVLHGQVPLPLLKRLLDAVDNIAAFKEEYPGIYSAEVFKHYKGRINIFAGGQKSHFLMYLPFGMRAYYSTFSTFEPSVPKLFWAACVNKDMPAAVRVVDKYDVPFFSRFTFGYWRATLERFGTAKRFMRPPDVSFTAVQMAELDRFFKAMGL